jgi:hypothetical protein
MCRAKSFIAPAVHLFINRYSQATAHLSPRIYLYLKHSVTIHKEAAEILTHSVLSFLHSLVPSHFKCIDGHQHHFSMLLLLPYSPNHAGNKWCSTHIPLLWGIRIVDAMVLLYTRLSVRHGIILAVIRII